ncbi:unnamed protein product [Microthlaspi erraticum]|uniref:Uncharacterized protein n=1 Tax=Microthlaspi erraticum TaxID=1685480 RepID=A0A6D2HH37_9BRAS|nr:unnamed protein product [Microthlaspi erraticum]
MYIWAKSSRVFFMPEKESFPCEQSLLLHVVYGPTLYQGKLQTLARPLLYSIKAFGAAARAIRHSKSSMGFVYSLTGHVSEIPVLMEGSLLIVELLGWRLKSLYLPNLQQTLSLTYSLLYMGKVLSV